MCSMFHFQTHSQADHFTTDVTSQVMRTAHKSQQGCGPDADAKDGLSVIERAKQALVKANVEAARKRAHAPLSSVRAPFENKAPRCESGTSVRGSTTPRCGSEYKLEGSVQSQAQPRPPARSRPKPKPKPHKPLTDFEKTFGTIDEDDHEDDVKENERLQSMAGCMEWSMFSSECKRLAQQEAIEDRMANQMELKVSAFHCKTCNTISEGRRPRCSGHDVKQVQVKKRWFQCASCGHRTASVARRFPAWRCDRCRMQDWKPCSMYIIGKDRVAEVQNELYGYGDKELLKISEPDFDTRL